ncbi:hypothetical protein [Oricola cellulosilytica]|uniref:hypothetical protein n=1 Tax=Oricola cellulosilytica TaxID=1429082 RepID=UPI001304C8CA|nr:hypothetical protein [Oricola cellulosilytica]
MTAYEFMLYGGIGLLLVSALVLIVLGSRKSGNEHEGFTETYESQLEAFRGKGRD